MPKRFKIKGSGKLVEYEKDATSKTGYRRKDNDEHRIEELKRELAHLEKKRAMPKTTNPKSSLPAIPRAKTNPEIYKRLGIEHMAIPEDAYDRDESSEEDVDPEASSDEDAPFQSHDINTGEARYNYDPVAMAENFAHRYRDDVNTRLYMRNMSTGDFTHYDKQTGKWIPSNDPDDIYYEGGGYGYNQFDNMEEAGHDFISVDTQGEDPRSHFQFTKSNIGKKKRILPKN
tara:strand:- start:40 stop:729 length:690 start_codon:yes stop_codon:yes gene_type:complete